MRRLSIVGDINADSFKLFDEELSALENESSEDVELLLSSEGGDPMFGIAFSSRIRTSPCRINITAHGEISSSAVLVLAAGEKRRMATESWVGLHEAEDKLKGRVSDHERQVQQERAFENQWCELLAFYTKTPKEKWDEFQKKQLYFTANQCLELGLIDEVF